MNDLQALLDISSSHHNHLCPRQILGVRIGLAGLRALAFSEPPIGKQLLGIVETDGCFADGVMAATNCSIGHRTLRVEDYGKAAATFVDTHTSRAIRVAPAAHIREHARAWVPEDPRHYSAQMTAYRLMPDRELLTVTPVTLTTPVEQIVSRPGVRTNCAICGEEIINGREIRHEGLALCRACAGTAYYREPVMLSRLEWSVRDD